MEPCIYIGLNLPTGDFGDRFLRDVLKQLDQRHLFGSIASVCKYWRKAYPAACSNIRAHIADIESGEQLAVWMDKHKEDLQGVLKGFSACFGDNRYDPDEAFSDVAGPRNVCRIFKSITAAAPQLRSLEVDVGYWCLLSGKVVPLSYMSCHALCTYLGSRILPFSCLLLDNTDLLWFPLLLGEEMSLSSLKCLTSLTIKRCSVDAPFLMSLLPLRKLQVLELIDVEGNGADSDDEEGDEDIDSDDGEEDVVRDFLVALPDALPQLSKLDLSGSMRRMEFSGGVGSLLPVFEKLPLVQLKLGAFEGFDEEELAMGKALPLIDVVIQVRCEDLLEQYGTWAMHPSRSMLRELHVFGVHDDDGVLDDFDDIMPPLQISAPHLTKLTLTDGCLQGSSISPIIGFTQLRALTIEGADNEPWIDDEAISMLSSLTKLVSLTLHEVVEVTGKGGSMEALAGGLVQLKELRFLGEGTTAAYGAALEAFQNALGDARNRVNIHGPDCHRRCDEVHSAHPGQLG